MPESKLTKEWLDAPFEIRMTDEQGDLLPDLYPHFRFTEENLPRAMEAFKKHDIRELKRLRVKQFESC